MKCTNSHHCLLLHCRLCFPFAFIHVPLSAVQSFCLNLLLLLFSLKLLAQEINVTARLNNDPCCTSHLPPHQAQRVRVHDTPQVVRLFKGVLYCEHDAVSGFRLVYLVPPLATLANVASKARTHNVGRVVKLVRKKTKEGQRQVHQRLLVASAKGGRNVRFEVAGEEVAVVRPLKPTLVVAVFNLLEARQHRLRASLQVRNDQQ
mmetsp:Transcript_9537/g.30222  ORF Transcript_9537/g.30222 Transcript_9537/m.30222 type:complete len:204 (+) Transcript_9537:12-623(+)